MTPSGRAKTPSKKARTPPGKAKAPSKKARTPPGKAMTPSGRAKAPSGRDRRRHRRIDVDEPCRITVGQRQHSGREGRKGHIANISRGGAAIRFGVVLGKPPPIGTPVNIYIGGVGDFPSRVMRTYENGFAVVFRPFKTWDKQLVDKLDSLLAKYGDGE